MMSSFNWFLVHYETSAQVRCSARGSVELNGRTSRNLLDCGFCFASAVGWHFESTAPLIDGGQRCNWQDAMAFW